MEDMYPNKRVKLDQDLKNVNKINATAKDIVEKCRQIGSYATNASEPWCLSRFAGTANSIGSGSFGKVYKAVDKCTNQTVAMKILNQLPDNCRNDLNPAVQILEFKIHLSIVHENVVKALGAFWFKSQSPALVLEYCSRGTLYNYLEDEEDSFPVTYERSRKYSRNIVDGLVHVHTNVKYLHMDLKPENILISANDVAKISDFGCIVPLESLRTVMTETNGGTPHYRPPEVLRYGVFDSTYDVWCTGCIIFEMIMGRHPFSNLTMKFTEQQKQSALRKMTRAVNGKFGVRFARQSSSFQTLIKATLGCSMEHRLSSIEMQQCGWLQEDVQEMKENQPL